MHQTGLIPMTRGPVLKLVESGNTERKTCVGENGEFHFRLKFEISFRGGECSNYDM